MRKLSAAQLEALRDAAAGVLFMQRESGRYVSRATIDALKTRGLISSRFPNEITDAGLAAIEAEDSK